MAKTPRTRSSGEPSAPTTIDLPAEAVTEATVTDAATEAPAQDATPAAAEAPAADAPPAAEPASAETAAPADRADPPKAAPAVPAGPSNAGRRTGIGAMLGAALIGGLVAAAGGVAANRYLAPDPAGGAARDARIAELAAGLDAIRGDLAAVKAKVDGLPPPVDLAPFEARLAALEGRAPATVDLAPLEMRIADLEQRIANLAVTGGDEAAAERLAVLDRQLAQALAEARAARDEAGKAAAGIAAHDARLAAVEAAAKAGQGAGGAAVARAIAAAAVKSAADRGQPFANELKTFAAVAPDAPEVAALLPFAEKGVPTAATLAGAATPAAEAMIRAAGTDNGEGGFLQSLIDSAKALVTVRPIGMAEGQSVGSVAARMEARCQAGDLEGALAEIAAAPEAAQAAIAGFAGDLKARVTVDTLVGAAMAAALAASAGG